MFVWLKSRLGLIFRTVLAVVLVLVQFPIASQAQVSSVGAGRLALVIGNSNYKNIPTLKNPERDAALISSTLRGLGFDVIEKTDLDRSGFEAAVSEALEKATYKNAVLFYYAGHGFQLSGRNYLVPTDASLTDKTRIEEETLSLDTLISRLQSRDRQTLLLLDACRNNPLPQSSREAVSSDGLAQIETGSGTFVAFATQPGNITNDGAGANSPFSTALAEHMPTEGISISDMMIRVRNTVEETTLERQTPWDQSSLRSQFYFNPLDEDSDALTEEDLELLAELDPELLEKFKKRFGLNYKSSDDAGTQPELVATVVPALRIEAADDAPAEIASAEPPEPAVDPPAAADLGLSIRATPEILSEGAAPELSSDMAAVEVPDGMATLEPLEPKPSLLISAAPTPEPAEPNETAPATIDLAIGAGVANDGSPTPGLDPGSISEAAKSIDTALPGFTIPVPLQRPEFDPEVEIALADPALVIDSAAAARPVIPAPASPALSAPIAPATPLVVEPAVSGPQESRSAADPAPMPAPKLIIGAPELPPAVVVTPVPEANEIAALMPEFSPSVELNTAPVLFPDAPGLVEDTAAAVPNDAAIANATPELPTPATAPSATTDRSDDATPRLTLTPTPTPTETTPPVELAALGPAEEIETRPESPLPDPAPVVDLEEQRRSLAARAQTELQRLGCYRSAIDGDWGPKSARALLRYYAEQKLTPDETEPTESLINLLAGETTVVCKTTVKAAPAVAPAKKKTTTAAPTPRKQPQAAKPVVKRASPPKKTVAATQAPAAKKLKGSNMIGAFR